MKTLNRPMFRYGGPIKEGIMTGMQDRPGYKKGSLIAGLISKAPGGQSLIDYGRGIIPRLFNKMKPTFKMQPGKVTQNKTIIGNKPDGTPIFGYSGTGQKYASQTMPPVPFMERAGAFVKENPYFTGVAAPFAVSTGASVIPPVVEGGLSLGKKALLQAADLAVPDFIFDQDKYFENKKIAELNENIKQNKKTTKLDQKDTGTQDSPKIDRDAEIEANRKRYYKLMGIDKMKKGAVYDSLIDASQIIQEQGGDLKGAIKSGTLQSSIINAISKNLDKSTDLKKQIDAAILKGEITKDIEQSKVPDSIRTARMLGISDAEYKDKILGNTNLKDNLIAAYNKQGSFPAGNQLAAFARNDGIKIDGVEDSQEVKKWIEANSSNEEGYIQSIVKEGKVPNGTYVINNRIFNVNGQDITSIV